MIKTYKKLFLSLGAVIILSTGTAICAQASTAGWVSEDGVWKYLEASGNYAYNTWKISGDNSYYLDSNGVIAVNQWIDDTYYVNGDGVMVKNSWIQLTEDTSQKKSGWYYVDAKGKMIKDKWSTIGDKKYAFDSDGKMRTGWYFDNDDIYYLGEKGYAKTGWLCLDYDEDNKPEDGTVSEVRTSASDTAKWFYFQTNGKAKRSKNDSYSAETIGDNKYYFNDEGVMMTGWVAVKSNAKTGDTSGISKFVYLGGADAGIMAKNKWLELSEHPGDSDDKDEISADSNSDEVPDEGESNWYYFDSDGTAAYLNSKAANMSKATTKIDGSSYFFNAYGVRQTGLIHIVTSSGKDFTGYFGENDSDGKMITGKRSNLSVDGESASYYFSESGSDKGCGYNGAKDDYLYYQGRLVKADSGSDFQVFYVNNKLYLVNESGKIQSSSKNYKVNGTWTFKISGGSIYFIDDDKESAGKVTSSDAESLPEIIYDKEYTL